MPRGISSAAMPDQRHPVVVVGGGIAGLAAAWQLTRDGVDVRLLESSDRVGGKLRTTEIGGRDVDEAADAFLARVPHATELVDELGLSDQLISPSARSAQVWTRSDGVAKLSGLPQPNVLGIPLDPDAAEELLGAEAAADIRTDLARTTPDPVRDDDTIGALVRRRLGDRVHEGLVDPLLGAINAGDTDTLSIHASSPQILAAAHANPSLVAALRDQASGRKSDAPVFFSFRGGMSVLIDALEASLRPVITTNAAVSSIAPHEDSLVVTFGGESLTASAVVLACPPDHAADLLPGWPDAVERLRSIPLVSVSLITLVYRPEDVPIDPALSGFLVPRADPVRITACSWASSKWPHLGDDAAVLRVSVGHAGDQLTPLLDDQALITSVLADLETTAGLTAAPIATRVSRWPHAFPQYTVGHLDRVAQIEGDLNPDGIFIAGMGYRGIGIPACIDQGRNAAVQAVLRLLE